MALPPFPMGTIIAERALAAYDENGGKHAIVVRLGAPQGYPSLQSREPTQDRSSTWMVRCSFQIIGLDLDDRIYAIGGNDAFEAILYTLNFVGDLLQDGYARLGFKNRLRFDGTPRDHWIWRFESDQTAENKTEPASEPPPAPGS